MYAHNQSNRFFVVFISARCNKRVYSRPFRMRQESFLKSALRLEVRLPFPTYSLTLPRETRRARAGGVISGAVKLSFGYQRDATPRARIRAREVIWLSETQTLLSVCPKVVEYNGPDERTNSHPRATKQPSAIVAQSIMESRPRRL